MKVNSIILEVHETVRINEGNFMRMEWEEYECDQIVCLFIPEPYCPTH